MKKCKDYNINEIEINNIDERYIIVNVLCPLFVKKYNILIKWGKTKTYIDGVELTKIQFEKQQEQDDWNVIVIAGGWSNNTTNRIIDGVLSKEYKNIAKENSIKIKYVTYAGMHSSRGFDNIIYDAKKGIEIKN